MARVTVTPTRASDLTPIDVSSGGLTAFTGDGIDFLNNGHNAMVLENTGIGANTVKITAATTSINGFPITDADIVLAAGAHVYVQKINPAVSGNTTLVDVVGTAAEVKYLVLDVR